MDESDELDVALRHLFEAYDIDESGELSRDEFVKIEMRVSYETGEMYNMGSGARMTMADKDSSGSLDIEEFRESFLTMYSQMGMERPAILEQLQKLTKLAHAERAKMGPRYHAGIRQALKTVFELFDVSGDASLSPEEWIAAQKAVAAEVGDHLDDNWIDEAAFSAADTNGDGTLDLDEFLEASFSMFEGVKKRSDQLLAMLQDLVKALNSLRGSVRAETPPVQLLVQKAERPEFQAPSAAWQDEGTDKDPERNMGAWKCVGEVAFPTNLETVDDVMALVRLVTKASADTWLSMYFYGPPQAGVQRTVSLLRGRTRGEGNVATMLSCLMKPNARPILFIKNARKRPSKLVRQPRAFLEQRRFYLDRRVGQLWGIDWETQLVGDGAVLPPRPLTIKVGDALVIEGPLSDDKGEYKYVTSVFMDDCDVMSKPIDETIEPVKGKKKKKKKEAGDAAEPDPLQRLMFVALRAGTCVLFVDLSWEDQEEKLARLKGLSMPVAENSVARIGPIEVAVEEQTEKPKDGTLVWWNGVEWSNKKGPAKRKKKKR